MVEISIEIVFQLVFEIYQYNLCKIIVEYVYNNCRDLIFYFSIHYYICLLGIPNYLSKID